MNDLFTICINYSFLKKVTEDSLAEKAGMIEGDIIVRINSTAASKLSHKEAHDILREVGNTFFLGVIRFLFLIQLSFKFFK